METAEAEFYQAETKRLENLSRIKMVLTPWYYDEFGNMCRVLYRER